MADFVKQIKEKINASASMVFTDKGINIDELKNVVETVAKDVKKVQEEKEEQKEQEMQELKKELDNDEENEEVSEDRKERIEKNKEFLGEIFENASAEDIEELANEMENARKFYDEVEQYMQETSCSLEEAEKTIAEKYQYTPSEIEFIRSNKYLIFEQEKRQLIREGKTNEQALEEIINKHSNIVDKEFKKQYKEKKEFNENGEEGSFLGFSNFLRKRAIKKAEEEKKLGDNYVSDNMTKVLNYDELQSQLKRRNKAERSIRFYKRFGEKPEVARNRRDAINEIVESYLHSDSPICDIMRSYRNSHPDVNFDEEDILKTIEKKSKSSSLKENYQSVDSLVRHEKKLLNYYIKMEALTITMQNAERIINQGGPNLNDAIEAYNRNYRLITNLNKQINHYNKIVNKEKRTILKEQEKINNPSKKDRKLSIEDTHFEDYNEDANLLKTIKSRNQVLEDNKAIKSIMKDKGYSMDKAAVEYFTFNSDRLKSYTEKEQDIIFGREPNIISNSSIFGKLTYFWKNMYLQRNEKVISEAESEQKSRERQLEAAKESDLQGDSIFAAMKSKKRVTRILKEAKKIREKKDKSTNLDAIAAKRNQKILIQNVVDRYLNSNKSVTEILQEMKIENPDIDFEVEEILPELTNTISDYINPKNVSNINTFERKISNMTLEIQSLTIAMENAKKQGRMDLVEKHSQKIAKLQANIEARKETCNQIKTPIVDKMTYGEQAENQEQETGDQELNDGLRVENMETQKGIFVNFKSLVKKFKITSKEVSQEVTDIAKISKKNRQQEVEESTLSATDIDDKKLQSRTDEEEVIQ